MPGIGIEQFNDFMTNTGPAILTGPKDVLNEAVKNTYLYGRMLKGAGESRVLKGGKTIDDIVMFDEKSTRQHVQPNQEFIWQNPQVSVAHSIPWKYTLDHIAWTEQEIELNDNGDYLSDEGWFHKFKDIKNLKWERLWTSWFNGCEDDLFATPKKSTMEDTGGKVPYSIPCFVNEKTNGLYTEAVTGTWTTKGGLSPTTYPKWDNIRETYADSPDSLAIGEDWDCFGALSRAFHKSRFAPLPSKEGYSDPTSNAAYIATSLEGVTNYEVALRQANDHLMSAQDPHYPHPVFAGIDLVWVSNLDTAALHPGPATGGLNPYNTATAAGPRYWGINPKYLFPVLHQNYYMKVGKVREHPNQVGTYVQVVQQWHNLYPRSLRRQFIVYPSATLS
jgi:hypothetical protein